MVEEVKIILQGEFKNKKAIVNGLKKVDGKLKDISFQSRKSSKQVNNLGSSLKKLAAIVGVAFIVRGFVNLSKSVLTAAGNMEQFNIAFTTMLGSADKAKDLLADIIDFAKKTPFEIEGLVRTTKQLLAYGIAQDEIIPTLENLGNIASGVGVPVERLALVFGQVRSTTKLLGQDLNQFTQAGVPLLAELAKSLNITEAEVIKLKESGKISFDDVKTALRNMTAEGGRFFNLMEEQSKTFLGTLSNAADGVQVVKIALGQALLPVAKRVANFTVGFFEDLKKTVDANSKAITEFAENSLKVLITLWKVGLRPIIMGLGFFIKGVRTLIDIPFVKWVGLATAALLSLNGVMKLIFLTNPLLLAIFAIVTAIGFLVSKFDTFSSGVQIALLTAVKVFKEFEIAITKILESILNKLSLLSKAPGFGWIDDAKNKFTSLKDSISKDIDDISNKIKILEEGGSIQTAITMPMSAEAPEPITQEIRQEAVAQQVETDADKLSRLKALNEQLLAEEKAFLGANAEVRSEADQLELENQLLQQQQKILNEGEFAERRAELDQAFLEGKIELQEFETELDTLHDEAKLEALEQQFAAEQAKTTVNNAKLIELKVKLEKTREGLTKQRNKIESFLENEHVKNAGKAANELVQLQNSKHKALAAVGKAAAIFQITVDTAAGAISAYRSLSPIPIIGPALGAAAAGAVIAFGAERLSNVVSSSFAVGASTIPQDMQANIHKGEMIIPASFAESIRRGELSLAGGTDTDALADKVVEEQSPIALNINFEGAQFTGITDEMVEDIGIRLGELIEEDIIPAIPTRSAT